MKILLTHSYFLPLDPKQLEAATPYPPLATLYAVAVLKKEGHEVHFFDTMFCNTAAAIYPEIDAIKPDALVIYEDGFNYLTKMCLTNMREAALEMISYAQQRNCKVIVSGSDSTDNYLPYLDAGAHFIIAGEAEQTLKETVAKLENRDHDFEKIQGLIFRKHDLVKKTGPRAVLRDLDLLPLPDWDLLDIAPYKNTWLKNHGYFSINMVTTRGCPYKCNWCAKPIYGNRYNSHAPGNIVRQIKVLQKKFGFSHIWFADDIFGLKPNWLKEFAGEVKKEQLSFRYKIQSRADLLLEENTIEHLAASGCETVWMGAESGSQKILDAMDKGTRVEQIAEASRLLKKHGIRPAFFLQFGYPGETAADIRLTIDMVNELLPEDIGISVSYPLPGTKFYDTVKAQLKTKSNWSDSDDLALMYRNAYSPAFYKQLHRYIHKSYRVHQSRYLLRSLLKGKELNTGNIRRAGLLPYYALFSAIEMKRLKQLEPDAAKSL